MKSIWTEFRWNMYPQGRKNARFFVCELHELLKKAIIKSSLHTIGGKDDNIRFLEHPKNKTIWIANEHFKKVNVNISTSSSNQIIRALYEKMGGNFLYDYPTAWIWDDSSGIIILLDINS